ncbi:MAG: alanine--tRNA ligase, partial [Hyphomicrobium sp.]|nr:alanine--tRNA ligase [Hyphomicrobium sp.]
FEMLGNFSFGDYFKERAIPLAWELLTKDYGIDPKRLTITVYHTDNEAYGIWKKLTGFGDDKIIRIATSDNFWQMGDTGPCGPCSEIFFDHGDKIFGGPPGSKDADGDRFVEIWNLVFMQYEQLAPGERIDLPKHSVDTGMGLERIAAVLQGVHDNYDIDLFKALIAASVQATGVPATGEHKASHRVIADHLRATSFLIADGVLPSNEGRGYVLRRIMRRAMRHAHLLGAEEPLMYRLVPGLVHEMGDTYHELQRAQPLITETLHLEERRFQKTLEKGLGLLGEASGKLKKGDVLPGETAFKLYDTYGFPLDLTEDALRARGVTVDTKGFDAAMERQRAEARKAWKGSGEAATESVWFEVKEKTGATEFLGYDTETAAGEIVALVKDGKEAKSLKSGDEAAIVVNQTPFYGESGGQIGDQGVIRGGKGALFRVTDTQKKAGGLFVHLGKVESGSFKTGEAVDLDIDHAARTAIRANHSATHLLHEALRQVLGDHVAQRGSLVAADRLRFDFVHTKPMTAEEIARVEEIANAIIVQNAPVETRLMGVEDAKQSGDRALFGEKYGDEVRVVSMGEPAGNAVGWSVELCGGTHAKRTGDIGLVKVIAETASASGVRRIEAFTADAARAYLSDQDARLKEIAAALHVRPEDAAERVKALLDERKQLERQLADAKRQVLLAKSEVPERSRVDEAPAKPEFLEIVEGVSSPKDLRSLVDAKKQRHPSGVFVYAANIGEKASFVVSVAGNYATSNSAVYLADAGSTVLGGKAGGRPDFAQGGGPDPTKLDDALEAIRAAIKPPVEDAPVKAE